MEIKRFNLETDLKKLEDYLRSQYLENRNMTSWLPERLHDLIYRYCKNLFSMYDTTKFIFRSL